ncbi:MAG: cation:proton antiporter [Euryarchaeota archaeon]|nr:cation:proton antiporter [Euryarchaeota archaeon]
MATSVSVTFFFVALVILVGFITSRIFQTTRLPDVPLLLSIGLILGPLNRERIGGLHSEFLADAFNEETFRAIAPFFSQLALIVILFDSGLKLDLEHVAKGFRPAFIHTLPTMTLTVVGISLVAVYVWGLPPLLSVILGVALSNVGQTVSALLVREINIPPATRSVYFIEMAIYDVISIPILVGLLEIAKAGGHPSVALFAESIARVASVSVMFGLVGGLIWIWVLLRLENYPYTYMVTLATLLLVYSLNSFAGGSGAIAALVFGLVIGNRNSILKLAGKQVRILQEGEKVHSFHDEITFFIRSFFFVFLGIIFSTGRDAQGERVVWNVRSEFWPLSQANGTATLFLVGCGLMLAAIVAFRYLVVRYVSSRGNPDHISLWAIYSRGLGTAVLATFPFTLPEYIRGAGPYFELLRPYEPIFFNAALLIILLTVVGTAITVFYEEKRLRRVARTQGGRQTSAKE